MADEEIAEQYADENKSVYQNTFVEYSDDYEEIKQAVLYGLAKGRKEQFEQDKKCCANCVSEGKVFDLEKENTELKAQIEKMQCCGNCSKRNECTMNVLDRLLCDKWSWQDA